jgi:dephospho-CoA kinase
VRWLVGLAGGIASGKTTLAAALHNTIAGSQLLAFGDVVRRHAAAAGLEPTRQSLQATGAKLVAAGWPAFVDELTADLSDSTETVIVDGIRHIAAYETLRARLIPDHSLLAYLQVDEASLTSRMAHRGESTTDLDHAVESEVPAVARAADVILNANRPLERLVAEVMQRLQ